jgi:elongation factor G
LASVKIETIRNLGIMAHIDAGKTTLTERMLFYMGFTHRIGDVDDGSTITDWMAQERDRGITITSAAVSCPFHKHHINIIDTPGHVDFTAEVERCLRVLDGAIAVFCAVGGVEPQSETVWHQAERYHIPRIVFVNKNDRVGADFYNVMQMMRDRLNALPLALHIPIGSETEYRGLVDLVRMTALIWDDNTDIEYRETSIPDDMLEEAETMREKLLETLSDFDDTILSLYLEGQDIPVDILKTSIRKQTLALKVFPVFCGSALKNKGIQPIVQAVIDYLPSPIDVPPVQAKKPDSTETLVVKPEIKAPLSMLLFKIMMADGRKLHYLRLYSGKLEPPYKIYNPRTGQEERIGRLFRVLSNKRERIETIGAGDIAAVIGLKNSVTGDTLCSPDTPHLLETMIFPEPVIFVAIEPKSTAEQDKLVQSLDMLAEEDPTFRMHVDEETGQTIISGMGELHLEILTYRLLNEFKVQAKVGKPHVSHRESIAASATHDETVSRIIAGEPHFAHVIVRVESVDRGSGFVFENSVPETTLPKKYATAVEKGIRESLASGIQFGYQIVDLKVVLCGGSFHADNSQELDFEYAASLAFRNACEKASPVLLSPVMAVEVTTPEEFLGDVISSMRMRDGDIDGIHARKQIQYVSASVPLSNMFGYSTDLRSITQGRATFTMSLSHFDVDKKTMKDLSLN